MSEIYNCTICRNYPCRCCTALRTDFGVDINSENYKKGPYIYDQKDLDRLRELCKELLEALKEWNEAQGINPDKDLIKRAEEVLK